MERYEDVSGSFHQSWWEILSSVKEDVMTSSDDVRNPEVCTHIVFITN